MDFGQRLKNLRLERGYTQQDLSSAVGVSTVAVRSWEHNTKKPNMDALIALGRFLNTSIDTLLDIQPKGNEQNYTFILSPAEKRFLQDYRELDSHGKKIVNTVSLWRKSVLTWRQSRRTAARLSSLQIPRESGISHDILHHPQPVHLSRLTALTLR